MKYAPIPPSLFVGNREKILSQMQSGSVAVVFAADQMPRNGDLFYQYRQSSDFFYLTGIEQERSILVLEKDEQKQKTTLFILEADETLVIWEGKKLSKTEALAQSGVDEVLYANEFGSYLRKALTVHSTVYLNKNENLRSDTIIETADEREGRTIQRQFNLHQYKRLAPLLVSARVIKSEMELELMSEACAITEKAFRRVLQKTRPGMFEYEVEAEITYEFIRNRANGHAYEPIVASGKNACYLHYTSNDAQLRDGDLLFMDFGAEYANYSADLSRAIPTNGAFSPRQRQVYDAVLRVMKHAKQHLVAGTTIGEYHTEVCHYMNEELIRLGLYSHEDVKRNTDGKPLYFRYYMHGTSHFMGLDTHDVGDRDKKLEPGMVFSCEPGIYIMEEGIGIRLENDIVITEQGNFDLMENIPIEPDEIEELMKK